MFYVLTKVSFPVSYECHSIFSSLVFVGLCPHTDYSPPDLYTLHYFLFCSLSSGKVHWTAVTPLTFAIY